MKDKLEEVFAGIEGLYREARWNKLGRKSIYCADSLALASLEWVSHNDAGIAALKCHRFAIEVPDELIQVYHASQLPKGWDLEPPTAISKDFAESQLFLNQDRLAIAVPSVLVPEEFNLIINPEHRAFPEVFKAARCLGKYHAPTRCD